MLIFLENRNLCRQDYGTKDKAFLTSFSNKEVPQNYGTINRFIDKTKEILANEERHIK
jgi:hypothetical protein